MRPVMGYNPTNWYKNFSNINWHNQWCPICGKWTNHKSGSCPELKNYDRK